MKLSDIARMVGASTRGSQADKPRSLIGAILGFATLTAKDSPLKMKDAVASPVYRDLSTPKLKVGESAFGFELPLLDLSTGVKRDTGDTVRLADFRGNKPVALIFGSYT